MTLLIKKMSSATKRSASDPPSSSSPDVRIYRSRPIEDRSSTFIALYSSDQSLLPRTLQRQPEVASAMHRILAWRRQSSQRSLKPNQPLFELGHDDDGEKYAGKHVAKVLEEEGVEGAVVVARWYGGILLGPVRFKWIEDCAREAIKLSKRGGDFEFSKSTAKRVKVDDGVPADLEDEYDSRSREELQSILRERDNSISVLRNLLAEKKGDQNASQGSPNKREPIYENLKNGVLKKLEKAKDRTIAFILAEIERAERNDKKNTAEDSK